MFRLRYFKEKASSNMTRKNFFYGRRSEYRHNYLPFDFYDFWITAKENQNQRYKNKIRDYLHTPFDWDEDQDFYSQSVASSLGPSSFVHDSLAHESTQTTFRSRAPYDDQYVDYYNDKELKQEKQIKRPKSSIGFRDDGNENNQKKKSSKKPQSPKNDKNKASPKDQHNGPKRETKSVQEQQVRINTNNDLNQHQKVSYKNEVETNVIDEAKPKSKKRNKKHKKKTALKNEFQTNFLNNIACSKNISNFDKVLARSISNLSVQAPQGWNLREYDNNKQQKTPKKMSRSASIVNFQPTRPPFALYGSASRSRDMSVKPTKNALANKNLAKKHHDKDAIIELTLHKLKKEATAIANEYSLVESHLAEHFNNGGRSDSRAWNSEYDEKYPDYSTSIYRKDLYLTQNPNRLAKSTLVNANPEIRRGPRTVKARIHY